LKSRGEGGIIIFKTNRAQSRTAQTQVKHELLQKENIIEADLIGATSLQLQLKYREEHLIITKLSGTAQQLKPTY